MRRQALARDTAASASASALSIAASIICGSSAASAGIGLHTSMPPPPTCPSGGAGCRELAGHRREVLEPNPGCRACRTPGPRRSGIRSTSTPSVSSSSTVRGRSSIGLGARGHDGDRRRASATRSCETSPALAAVDAADAAGREHAELRVRRDHGGGADGRGRGRAVGEVDGEIGGTGLRELAATARDALEHGRVEADARLAIDDRDRRRYGAAVAHDLLELARDLEVVGPRQPVRDQGRLERDHRPPRDARLGDLSGSCRSSTRR